jgi:N-acetylglucosaminyl-diphospho-decaprenol L-rhamnosyltransferase
MNSAGAVIVTYNSEAEIGPCLDAALSQLDHIVVVDNGSTDGTSDEVLKRPAVQWIRNASNRGFAAAVNQGFCALDCSYALLLNPDAVLLTDIQPLLEACGQPGVAAAAGKLVDDHNRPQAGFSVRRFPSTLSLSFEILGVNRLWSRNPVNRRFRCLDMDHDRPSDVEQPAGAFLMVRRDVWQELGGFDEHFHPVWFEEVDFLKRARDRGYRAVYRPLAAARHKGGHAVRKLAGESRQIYWYANLLRYSSKHLRPFQRRVVSGALLFGLPLRMLVEVVSQKSLGPLRAGGKIMRLALKHLMGSQTRGVGGAGGAPVLAKR